MRKATRISLALGASAALLSVSALPASAAPIDSGTGDESTATIEVEGGSLQISVVLPEDQQDTWKLMPGEDVNIDMGQITVTDHRAVVDAAWISTFAMSDFVSIEGGSANIGATEPTYKRSGITWIVNNGEPSIDAAPAAFTKITPDSTDVAIREAVRGNNTATWGAAVDLKVPEDAVVGKYTATMTHSVLS